MTNIQPAPQIGDLMQALIAGVRRTVANPEGATTVDKVLVVAALLGIAVIVAWPKGKPTPAPIVKASQVGKQVWQRRNWWLE